MRKTAKALLALGMSAAMVAGLVACGNTTDSGDSTTAQETESVTNNDSSADETEEETEEEGGYASTGVTVESGKGIDFEDGNSGFIVFDTVVAGSGAGSVEVVDFNGSKAAKLVADDTSVGVDATGASTETPTATPYIAIDAGSLLGDKIADCKGIQMDLAVEYSDGSFSAVSGSIYAGNSAGAESDTWSVYMAKGNPKTISMTMDSSEFSAEDANIFMVSLSTVGAPATEVPTIYIDNIIFLDADGNALEIGDTSVEFNEAGMGVVDWSNGVQQPMGETVLAGVSGTQSGGWWPQDSLMMTCDQDVADAMGYTYVDPALLTSDSVITIYFTDDTDAINDSGAWQTPYIRSGQWDDLTVDDEKIKDFSYDVKISNTDVSPYINKDETIDGTSFDQIQPDTMVNKSWAIVQYTYAQIAETMEDDNWPTDLTWFGIADMGTNVTIDKVTIGTVSAGESVAIANATGSSSGWGQAVTLTTIKNDNGVLDPAIITPGTIFVVDFTATDTNEEDDTEAPLELILQSWSGGESWAKVAPYSCSDSQALFSYDDMVAAYGDSNFEETLDNLLVGDCDCNLTVIGVSYIPGEE